MFVCSFYIQSGKMERTSRKMKCNRFVKYMCFYSLLPYDGGDAVVFVAIAYGVMRCDVMCVSVHSTPLIRVGSVTNEPALSCFVPVLYSALCNHKLYDSIPVVVFFFSPEFKTTGTILFHGRFMHIRLF